MWRSYIFGLSPFLKDAALDLYPLPDRSAGHREEIYCSQTQHCVNSTWICGVTSHILNCQCARQVTWAEPRGPWVEFWCLVLYILEKPMFVLLEWHNAIKQKDPTTCSKWIFDFERFQRLALVSSTEPTHRWHLGGPWGSSSALSVRMSSQSAVLTTDLLNKCRSQFIPPCPPCSSVYDGSVHAFRFRLVRSKQCNMFRALNLLILGVDGVRGRNIYTGSETSV
jgi:hypothetical protein